METRDLASAIETADRPVLVDCQGTWLTAVVDEAGAWDLERGVLARLVEERLVRVVDALEACPHDLVVVTSEVGLGIVPEHRSGRLLRDLLGEEDGGQRIRDVVTRAPVAVFETSTLRVAADHMILEGVGRLAVVSVGEPGRLTGIITRSDILAAHAPRLRARDRRERSRLWGARAP